MLRRVEGRSIEVRRATDFEDIESYLTKWRGGISGQGPRVQSDEDVRPSETACSSNRKGSYEHTSFTFLGFMFRQREARNRWGQHFSGFLPARSDAAQKIVRGWMQYGAFYRSKLHPLLERINSYLMRFLRRKLKRLRGKKKALQYWKRTVAKRRSLFAHWAWATSLTTAW